MIASSCPPGLEPRVHGPRVTRWLGQPRQGTGYGNVVATSANAVAFNNATLRDLGGVTVRCSLRRQLVRYKPLALLDLTDHPSPVLAN